ncbi:pyruvate dehydrogenase (quinone) [Friedmanniella endophytica]|uniref:Pyruvate dehydrogenase (Quinone) n=1 Tax=Microlunatus kandeliicorticis TaxID=1759536 RepID=A0A7W3ITM5_9ACTN|nr:thiamine pyrophosphate-requiring protein [Microlunatus kandeliicorticis]MBA8795038.1 pyruvate dehydrogenase (quinone) [Microlunatus kandeliicorticis]
MNVAEHLVDRLHQWGVHRVYGYPGDGIGGVLAAVAARADDVAFVQVRHEETAGFAATADVKYGGSPIGCCAVTSGPGALHALNGLYDAKLDRVPVVALLGQTAVTALGGDFYQEVDLASVFADVGAAYLQTVTDPSQVKHMVDRACRSALATRSPAVLILPSDVQEKDAMVDQPDAHGYFHTSPTPSTTVTVAPAADLEAAADVLAAGERVAFLVGIGARGATAEVTALADLLGAGAAKALLGKPVLDDRLPWVTGAIGLLGTTASWDLMRHCDTLLVLGSNMPYSEYYPAPGQARAVQIDLDGSRCGLRYPTEVNLVGDLRATVEALLPLVRARTAGADRGRDRWRAQVAGWKQRWDDYSQARSEAKAKPVNPEAVVRGLSRRLDDDHQIAVDCGTATSWYARDLELRPTQFGSLAGLLLSMGGGMPYAIAAKFAQPDRPCLAMIGDGAMQMNGVNELITVSRYWEQWADPRLVVLVLNNRDLSYVTWETRAMLGAKPDPNQSFLPDVRYADWARQLGLDGVRLDDPTRIDEVLDAAMAARRPFVIDAVVDADIPLIPPHLTADQVIKTAKAEFRGDPAFFGIVAEGVRESVVAKVKGLLDRP